MDEKEKPFDIVSIVILIMIGLANDAAEIVFDLLAATGVGLPGEAIMKPIDFLVDGIVTTWFFFKVGFGSSSVLQLVDDIAELVGIPGRTLCIGLGIWLANHPNSQVGKFAKVVGTVESLGGSELGEAAEGAEAAGQAAGETAAEAAGEIKSAETAATEGGIRKGTGTEAGGETEDGNAQKNGERPEKSAREKEIEEELTPEAEKNPVEVEGQRLREGPTAEDFPKNEQDETEAAPASLPPEKPSTSEKSPRNTKPKLQDIRDLNNVPPSEENEDEDEMPREAA